MANIFNKISAKAGNVIESLSNQPSKVDASYKEVETEAEIVEGLQFMKKK